MFYSFKLLLFGKKYFEFFNHFLQKIVPSMSKFKKNNNTFKTELNFFHLSTAFEKDIAHFSKKQKTFNLKVIILK